MGAAAVAGTTADKKRVPSPRAVHRDRPIEEELCRPRGYLKACLLVLTVQRPAHGYELTDRLQVFGYRRDEATQIYRALRWLQDAGLASASWDTRAGPARRVFKATAKGKRIAEKCAARWHERHQLFQQGVMTGAAPPPSGEDAGQNRTFEAVVEAKVAVQAADQRGAQHAIEEAFGACRPIAGNVRPTGEAWVYDLSEVNPNT